MAITSPSERIWWKEPIHKVELIWIIVAFLWGLAMFFTMIWWHAVGKQNLSNEAYRVHAGPVRGEGGQDDRRSTRCGRKAPSRSCTRRRAATST